MKIYIVLCSHKHRPVPSPSFPRTKTIQAPHTEYVDPSSNCELFIENIDQSVRYIIEIRREFFSDNNNMHVCQK